MALNGFQLSVVSGIAVGSQRSAISKRLLLYQKASLLKASSQQRIKKENDYER